MKRIISLLMVLVITSAVFVSCVNGGGNQTSTEKNYNLSIGVVGSGEDKANETAAVIVTDADSKIVLCRIDCIEYEPDYEAGELVTDTPISKVAKGENYKMPSGSWAKQVKTLEDYVVGKTQSEVAAIAVEGGRPTDTELSAGCTFVIVDILKAIDNAFTSEHKVSFTTTATSFTAGLNVAGEVEETDDNTAKFTANFSSAVLADGKVVAAILDAAEAEIGEDTDFSASKREQGDDYKMTSGAWYTQADAYAKSAIGRTKADISTLATEGVAGCTMSYSTLVFKAGLEAAVKNSR